jgi:hypothetical protein
MSAAADRGQNPYAEAVRVQKRLFTAKPIALGVEESLLHPDAPCGLSTDAERARHVRKRLRQFLGSTGQWEDWTVSQERPLREVRIMLRDPKNPSHASLSPDGLPQWAPALSEPKALERSGAGILGVISADSEPLEYGRTMTVADRYSDDRISLAKWVRRMIEWHGRQADLKLWHAEIAPLVIKHLSDLKQRVVRFDIHEHKILAVISVADMTIPAVVDSQGVAWWHPVEQQVMLRDCGKCPLVPTCQNLPTATAAALLWRRLGLVDPKGVPTLRGQVASFFSQGDGLAIAAALEDPEYPLRELVYDLANLDAGFRFAGDENRWSGRLALACQKLYGAVSVPGYLEQGMPPRYGSGASEIVAEVHQTPASKSRWVTDVLGVGDIDRIIIEWRSRMRQVSHSPVLNWSRWRDFQSLCKSTLNEVDSPTLTELPPLEYHQTKRMDHRLILRRH